MAARTKTPRPVEPLSEEDFLARCDCRCSLLPGTHPAGACAQVRDAATTNGDHR